MIALTYHCGTFLVQIDTLGAYLKLCYSTLAYDVLRTWQLLPLCPLMLNPLVPKELRDLLIYSTYIFNRPGESNMHTLRWSKHFADVFFAVYIQALSPSLYAFLITTFTIFFYFNMNLFCENISSKKCPIYHKLY